MESGLTTQNRFCGFRSQATKYKRVQRKMLRHENVICRLRVKLEKAEQAFKDANEAMDQLELERRRAHRAMEGWANTVGEYVKWTKRLGV